MRPWHLPDLREGIVPFAHICPTWADLEAWCAAHISSLQVGQVILAHAESLAEAERLWASPSSEEAAAIRCLSDSLGREAGLQPGDILYWGFAHLRIGEFFDPQFAPDDTSLSWEEWNTKCTELLRELGMEEISEDGARRPRAPGQPVPFSGALSEQGI